MTDPKEFFALYCDFVTKVTSGPSLDIDALKESLESIQKESPIDVPRLMTAALGLSSEGGEFVEIVKKMSTLKRGSRGKSGNALPAPPGSPAPLCGYTPEIAACRLPLLQIVAWETGVSEAASKSRS